MTFAESHGPPQLLMDLALVTESPFDADSVEKLKSDVVGYLSSCGYRLVSHPKDRKDVPIDYRFLQLLLDSSEDPEVHLGSSCRAWGPASQGCQRCTLRSENGASWSRRILPTTTSRHWKVTPVWRSNYSTLAELAKGAGLEAL